MKTENQMLKHEKSANRIEHQNRKTEVFWHKNRKTDQKNIQNRKTENPSAPLLNFLLMTFNCLLRKGRKKAHLQWRQMATL